MLSPLEAMLAGAEQEQQQARLHFELWKMQGIMNKIGIRSLFDAAEHHKQQALALYKKLWENTQDVEYKKCLEELSVTLQDDK